MDEQQETLEAEPEKPVVPARRFGGLLRRKECWSLTWRGRFVLLCAFILGCVIFVRSLDGFLSTNEPVHDGALIIEGWAADNVLEAAIAEFKSGSYSKVFVTGGPIDHGAPLSEYHTEAEFGGAVLEKKGLDTNMMVAVPSPFVPQDRTYTEAVTLNKWFREHGQQPSKLNLVTEGPHARRSRLLYQKAFGKGVFIGVMSVPAASYDHRHWWRTSQGVRTMMSEALAYAYARFLFHPRAPDV